MSFDPLNVPDALKAERRWVNWKSVWSERDGKAGRQTKVPNGKSNDPSTWVSFPEAMRRAERKYPRLGALHDRVAARPNIAAYLASERRIPFNEDGIFRHYRELDA